VRDIDFAAHYEALGLEPGASDPDIARAKRAYNELYHSDRLAHMSGAAQAIAAEKVRAANQAARILLDPSARAARDQWVREQRTTVRSAGPHPVSPAVSPDPGPADVAPPQARTGRRWGGRLLVGSVAVGGLLGAGVFLLRDSVVPRREVPVPTPRADSAARSVSPPSGPERPVPTRPPAALRPVVDSAITVPADGGWTPPIAVGGPTWRASFIPDPDNVMYRVRTNGDREYVLNSEPGFRRIDEAVRRYEFSSLTGRSFQIRYTRWLRSTPAGTTLHTRTMELPADGSWSQRVWLGPLGFRWDVDRAVAYQVRDDEGRIIRVPATVRSVVFGKTPTWIRFRSTDSLPLTLTFRYTVP